LETGQAAAHPPVGGSETDQSDNTRPRAPQPTGQCTPAKKAAVLAKGRADGGETDPYCRP